MNNRDLFAHKSKSWDLKSRRVESAKKIADGIKRSVKLNRNMHIMDFGAGTGLLSYFLSDEVGRVTGVDNSPSMLEVFKEKSHLFSCPTEIMELDLTQDSMEEGIFDGIVSSMTLHHIEDIDGILNKMYRLLKTGGFIALADLDSEDGSFHNDNNGVFHFGFDREELLRQTQKVGFKMVKIETINIIKKPNGDFPIFLMSGLKQY